MSKTKTIKGKDYRWDAKKKTWVRSYGSSGGEALGRFAKGAWDTASSLFKKKDKKKDGLKKNTTKKGPKVKSVGTVDFNVNTESGLKAYNKALAASRTNKAKTNKAKDKSTTEALHGERNRKEANKRKLRPKPGSAGARIQQKLKDGGHTQEGLDKIASRHQAWKKARKEGTLADWEKKYHPDRTPKYKNKKKSTPKPTPKAEVTPKKKKKKQDGKPGGKYQFTTM